MKRKVLSMLLALAFCVGLTVPVLAAESKTLTVNYLGDVTIHNVVKESTITVKLISGEIVTETLYWLPSTGSEVTVEYGELRSEGDTDPSAYGFMPYKRGNDGVYTVARNDSSLDYATLYDFEVLSDGSVGTNIIPENRKLFLELAIKEGIFEKGTSILGGAVIFREAGFYCAFMDEVTPLTPDTPSSWAVEQVNAAISAGLVPDTLQSKYTTATTRAEFCALAVALYENVTGKTITDRKTFDDTKDVSVEKAAAIGVVSGTGNNNFSPDNQLTREQAATMLSRLADAVGKPLAKQAATFADNGSISSWAIESVGQIQAAGIMGGVGNNTFAPKNDYTREQSIITILRLFDVVK